MHQSGWKYDILNAATPKVNSPRSTKEKKDLNPLLSCVRLIAAHIRMGSFFFVFLGGSHEARQKSSVKPQGLGFQGVFWFFAGSGFC
jgi:hypothetical protein